jgi:Ca2+-binding EF-hand superfamily protein
MAMAMTMTRTIADHAPPPHTHQASTNYKEAFSLFDKRGTGRVPTPTLGDLLRACGQNPTLAEIGELEKPIGTECTVASFVSPYEYEPLPCTMTRRTTETDNDNDTNTDTNTNSRL